MTEQSTLRSVNPWWVTVVSGMASYIDSAAIVSFGIAIVIYQKSLGLTPAEIGGASGALTFGIAIGAIFGGRLADRFGRRPVFTATMIVILIGVACLIVSPTFVPLLVGAILVGVGTGADLPVSLSTISEMATDGTRGKMIGFTNVQWMSGILLSTVLSIIVGGLGHLGGQIMFIHVGVVALLVLIARLTIPESEIWRAARQERRSGVSTKRAQRASIWMLLRTPYVLPFVALIVFYSLVNLTANTSGQFGVYLLVNVTKLSVPNASLLSLIWLPLVLVLAFVFMRVADGRRRFLYFTIGGVCFIVSQLIPAVFGFSIATYVVSLVFYAVAIAFAFETIMKIWTQESFPTLLRTTAQGSIIAVARIIAALLASFTPTLITLGPGILYTILSVCTAVGVIVAWLAFRRRDAHDEFAVENDPETRAIRTAAAEA